MHTLSKRLNYCLNLGLVLTLLISLLPPAPLAVASSLERQTDKDSQPYSIYWPQSRTRNEPIPTVSHTEDQATTVVSSQDEITPVDALPARTFALPFDFSHATNPTPKLSALPGTELTELEGNTHPATFSNLSQLPLSFVPNAGQLDPSVHFQAHGLLGSDLFFAPQEVILALPGNVADSSSSHISQPPVALRLRFEGANPTPELVGGERLPGIVNYFLGNNPDQWRTNLPTYKNLVYRDLYPGIDLYTIFAL